MTLQRYLARQLVSSLFVSTLLLALFFLPPLALSAASRLEGVPAYLILGYLPYVAVEALPYLVPMAFLLAVVATYGRLAADGEWTAIRMAGIHPARVVAPAVVIAAILAGVNVRLLRSDFPELRFRQRLYQHEALTHVLRERFPGRTRIHVGDVNVVSSRRTGDVFQDVVVHLPEHRGRAPEAIVADRGVLASDAQHLMLHLEGVRGTFGKGDYELESADVVLSLAELARAEPVLRDRAKFMTSAEIVRELDAGRVPVAQRRQHTYEVGRRDALGMSCVVFALVGVALGLGLRRGGLPILLGASAAVACAYYVLAVRGVEELVLSGALAPLVGAWSPPAIGAACGVAALWRVLRR